MSTEQDSVWKYAERLALAMSLTGIPYAQAWDAAANLAAALSSEPELDVSEALVGRLRRQRDIAGLEATDARIEVAAAAAAREKRFVEK